jgi:hypothetical protein
MNIFDLVTILMRNYVFLTLALLGGLIVSACISKNTYVSFVDGAIIYDGMITKQGAKELITALKNKKVNQFYINSIGGSSEAGVEIGEFIMANDITVIAIGDCYSSCANYIFLPSKTKKAVETAKIGLHGGYASYDIQRKKLLEKIPLVHKALFESSFVSEKNNIMREENLLTNSGVKNEIIDKSAQMTYYGEANFNAIIGGEKTTYSAEKIKNTNFELWFPPENEYKKWGINIELIKPPEFMTRLNLKISKTTLSRQSTSSERSP